MDGDGASKGSKVEIGYALTKLKQLNERMLF
jgi:hypothetical protein